MENITVNSFNIRIDNPIYHGSGIYESRYGLKVVKLVSELRGLDLLCERCKPWIFNLPEVG